jgi:hypothetical protein
MRQVHRSARAGVNSFRSALPDPSGPLSRLRERVRERADLASAEPVVAAYRFNVTPSEDTTTTNSYQEHPPGVTVSEVPNRTLKRS